MCCAPIKTLGLHLRPPEFILAVKYRLGLPIYTSQGPCPACLRLSDVKGDHALCCGVGSERIARHNALRDAIFLTAANAALGPVKEGRFLLAHDRKLRAAQEDCRRQGLTFVPLAVEALGGWHPLAETQVRKLGSCLALHSGQDEAETITFLWRRLSILLQKGNCAILGNRTPSFPAPDIGGVL